MTLTNKTNCKHERWGQSDFFTRICLDCGETEPEIKPESEPEPCEELARISEEHLKNCDICKKFQSHYSIKMLKGLCEQD